MAQSRKTTRSNRRTKPTASELRLLSDKIQAITRFPDQNPNPVLRLTVSGELIYANPASQPVRRALGVEVGGQLAEPVLARLLEAADENRPVEIVHEHSTFSVLPVVIADMGFINLYGTDITARKAIDKFPDQNPHPVLRIDAEGKLIYANRASGPIVEAHGLELGQRVPSSLRRTVEGSLLAGRRQPIEVAAGRRVFELLPVSVPEFGFVNLYGTDVTAARQIAEANRENERLLLNILPPPIAERLRRGERIIADRFEDVTLLMADIVGFTSMSSHLPATEVVDMLNAVFSAVDELVDRHGLEKVKTIGDAYMVVGGLPSPLEDHVERVADMALDLAGAITRLPPPAGRSVSVRIGVHCGPAVAGVIGIKKFIYDVWGDTVNIASRMESLGVPGRIQVTHAVYERLRDGYELESRGLIDVKGIGPMPTYFLLGRRRAPARGQGRDARARSVQGR
ncbi:MAG TPA: adenylate/guanylate cyclase domain-containing protein [Candidatus Limnocylindria bacterium]|nr:adenylate/guanylate cyclase domain-containing protein [Candidatus Limnocylindria bacterium]